MTIMDGLFQFLAAQPGITALVPASRIFRYVIPQNSIYPVITLQWVDTVRDLVQEGANWFAEARMQISCFSAMNDSESRRIAEQVRVALHGYRGTWGTVQILRSALDEDIQIYDDVSRTHQTVVDVLASFHEQEPIA
jgi:Protein of unknown function (DUF3168)